MLVRKAFKFRSYPNKKQEILIHTTFGCSRFVFNHFLAMWNDVYKTTGNGLFDHACSAVLPGMKRDQVVGIDLGITDLVIFSTGDRFKETICCIEGAKNLYDEIC